MRLHHVSTIVLIVYTLRLTTSQEARHCSAKDAGHNFTTWRATIDSPGFKTDGGRYPAGENCNWTITIPAAVLTSANVTLKITFKQFNIPKTGSGCPESGDYLQIVGLAPGRGQPICSDQTFTISSTFPPGLQVIFVSDQNEGPGEGGFSFTFEFPDHPCAKCRKDQVCDEGPNLPRGQIRCRDPCLNHVCNHGKCFVDDSDGQPYCKCDTCWYGQEYGQACLSYHTCARGKCLDTSQNFNKPMCNCSGVIQEDLCDDDPCQPNPCMNDGACATNGTTGHSCTCLKNYIGEDCEHVNFCASNPCQNGGVCKNMEARHSCECTSEFYGENCTIPNDGTYCREGVDSYKGSHIFWRAVKMGDDDAQPCPYANGRAIRHCSEHNDVNGSYAYWEVPDLSQCVSPEFRKILKDAKSLAELESVAPQSVLNLTATISEAISNGNNAISNGIGGVSNGSNVRIYAGDLTAATETVRTVGHVMRKTESSDEDLHRIAVGYGTAVNHIINPEASAVWRFSRVGYLENRITSLLDSMETFSSNVADRNGYLENRITSLLDSMETFSSNVADRTSYLMTHSDKRSTDEARELSRQFAVTLEHLDYSVQVLDRRYDFSRVSTAGTETNSSITLPQEVFVKAIQSTSDPYIHMYSAKFPSVSTLLEQTNAKITAPSPTHNITAFLNSDIISTSILNVPSESFTNLEQPVVLTFSLEDSTLPRILKRNCVFMNMSATSRGEQWATEGCRLDPDRSNLTHTVCVCSHLTNFAVLMDVYGIEDTIDDFNSKILTYFSYVGGGLSIVGCVISIFVFEFFRLKNERIRVHEQLAATIILVQLFFLFGIDRTENRKACKAIAICLHYFLLAMFGWMLVEGAHLYLALVKVFKSHSHMKKYVFIGWGIPLIIVGITVGVVHDYYGTGPVCWLPRNVLLAAFVPPVALVVTINTVVLLVVMRIMLKSMARGSKMAVEDRSSLRIGLKAAAVLLPLLGLTWTFGFLSVTSKETLVFTYLFTFFNSTQGIFFFVFHCLLSVDVQNAYERRSRRRSQMRLTESSSSSKNSVKTASTDLASTLDRRRRNNSSGSYSGSHRAQSVTFDDDYYVTSPNNGSLSSRVSNKQRNNISRDHSPGYSNANRDYSPGYNNAAVEGDADYDVARTPSVLNNSKRSSLRGTQRSSDGYTLYYGKDGSSVVDQDELTIIDKNQLYATVQKGL